MSFKGNCLITLVSVYKVKEDLYEWKGNFALYITQNWLKKCLFMTIRKKDKSAFVVPHLLGRKWCTLLRSENLCPSLNLGGDFFAT